MSLKIYNSKIPISQQVGNIHKLSKLLQAKGIKHWIDFGTLLGAVREGGLVDTDVDFDFNILKPDKDRLLALKDQILAETNILLLDAPLIRGCPVHKSLITINDVRAIRSCVRIGLLYIDFYTCDIQGKNVLHAIEPYSFKYYFIDELEEIDFEGYAFPAPRHRMDLLTHRYGTAWRTPIGLKEFKVSEFQLIIPFEQETTAYVAGAFDVSRNAQLNILERGKQLFERIVVGVYSDEVLREWHGVPMVGHEERIAAVRACGLADEIITDPPLRLTEDFMKQNKIDYVLSGRKTDQSFVAMDETIMQEKLHTIEGLDKIS